MGLAKLVSLLTKVVAMVDVDIQNVFEAVVAGVKTLISFPNGLKRLFELEDCRPRIGLEMPS